jgi:hypothetical protein
VDDDAAGDYLVVWELTGVLRDRPFRLAVQHKQPGCQWTALGQRLSDSLRSLHAYQPGHGSTPLAQGRAPGRRWPRCPGVTVGLASSRRRGRHGGGAGGGQAGVPRFGGLSPTSCQRRSDSPRLTRRPLPLTIRSHVVTESGAATGGWA